MTPDEHARVDRLVLLAVIGFTVVIFLAGFAAGALSAARWIGGH